MDGDGVDRAVRALGQELVQPRRAHRGAAVRDGGGDELGLAGEGLHVRLPRLGGVLGAHVGLRSEVRLVEAKTAAR